MKTLCVLQHVEAEYLGLMEDHFESRNIRFQYCRPFTPGGTVPADAEGFDGLILLGAGPLGIVSGNLVPSLGPELRLVADFLARDLPIVAVGLGAAILTSAAGGGAEEAPLRFTVETAHRTVPDGLAGHLPEAFPVSVYMRDRPVVPESAQVLATGETGEPLVFQIGANVLGFVGHPGIKSGMIEDLIMEFDESPDDPAATLQALRDCQADVAAGLSEMMVGLIVTTEWM